jgi:hypothetical protein
MELAWLSPSDDRGKKDFSLWIPIMAPQSSKISGPEGVALDYAKKA